MSEKPITSEDLPMVFQAKYLGACKAQGLWGIKHTRKPVDILVESAKSNRQSLPQVEVKVTTEGLQIVDVADKSSTPVKYNIDTISYGVQDVNFTRVFCMIICNQTPKSKPDAPKPAASSTKDARDHHLFMCHAFACDSKHTARQLTFALSAAFKHFADKVKSEQEGNKLRKAIDLRTQAQIDALEDSETEA